MDDRQIIDRIDSLIDEEHRLREAGAGLSDEDRERLADVEVRLDQCWDLLRQRRAKRSAGLDPEDSEVRDERVVETYDQ